jgi:hypothetical protein
VGFTAVPEVELLAGGVWGGSHRPAAWLIQNLFPACSLSHIADVLAVAKPRGLMLCPGRYAEHRALLLCLGRGEDSRPSCVALLWSYEAKAERCENNFTSERRWASQVFTVSRRSPARGN